jgi:hypothetical protein
VDPIEIDRVDGMILVNREISRNPIHLARAGVNDTNARADRDHSLKKAELGNRVDGKVSLRHSHGGYVTDFTGEVKDDVRRADDIRRKAGGTDVDGQ